MTDDEQGYTPTTEEVLDYVLIAGTDRHPHISDEETRAAFQRWLDQRDAATLTAHRVTLAADSREALVRGLTEARWPDHAGGGLFDMSTETVGWLADALLASGVVQVTTPTETDEEQIVRTDTWEDGSYQHIYRDGHSGPVTSRPAHVAPPTEEWEHTPAEAAALDEMLSDLVPVDALGFPTQEGATFRARLAGDGVPFAAMPLRVVSAGVFERTDLGAKVRLLTHDLDSASIEDVRPRKAGA